MSLPVVFRLSAQDELVEIRDQYEAILAGLGTTFIDRVAVTIDRISQTPEIYGTVWRDVRAAPIKRHSHIIYYRVHADRVEVLTVVHGRRNPSYLRRRFSS